MIAIKDVETYEEFETQAIGKSIFDWFYDDEGQYHNVRFDYTDTLVKGNGWYASVQVRQQTIKSIRKFDFEPIR